jgi:hypothetical protein
MISVSLKWSPFCLRFLTW